MGFFSKLFGGGKAKGTPPTPKVKSKQLPSSMVAKEFGEVNIANDGRTSEISMTILMEPQGSGAEGWQTGMAIDASGSMEGVFGKGLEDNGGGSPPTNLLQQYQQRGWLTFIRHEGQDYPILNGDAKSDLVAKGYFKWTANVVEPVCRQVTAYLASQLDADGGTTVIYWACGDGSQIDVIGDLTADDCEMAKFEGPAKYPFGQGTVLTPAVRYFVDRFADAKNGMYIFMTDGELHDLEEVKKYTIKLCKEIAAKKRNPVKCVLIGIGDDINEDQMEELDDLDSGTEVDIWDHKIAKEMRSLMEIFAEVVSENQIVAPSGRIFDDQGTMVKQYTDGLPAKISFSMPASSKSFELEVMGQRIKQSVVM
ncbi:MAG: hypothetical protein WD768_13860 [Phycisphaeraceae bacterium]